MEGYALSTWGKAEQRPAGRWFLRSTLFNMVLAHVCGIQLFCPNKSFVPVCLTEFDNRVL